MATHARYSTSQSILWTEAWRVIVSGVAKSQSCGATEGTHKLWSKPNQLTKTHLGLTSARYLDSTLRSLHHLPVFRLEGISADGTALGSRGLRLEKRKLNGGAL